MITLSPTFQDFLKQRGFTLEETKLNERILIYASYNFKLRIGEDFNGYISIDIKRTEDEFKWIELDLLRSYILKNEDYLEGISFETAVSFFIGYFENISKVLSNDLYNSTITALDLMGNNRARVIFGIDKI